MNSSRGIFEPQEGFAPAPPAKSPFAVSDDGPATSPFAIVSEPESPFAAMKDEHPTRLANEPGRPVKLPERRPAAGETPAAEARSPFAAESSNPSPFDAPASASSPFASSPPPVPAASASSSPFGFGAEPAAAPATTPAPAAVAAAAAAALAEVAPAPAPVAAPAPVSSPAASSDSSIDLDSGSIRQLALRAIFGVDRELGAEEMLQRARGLSGIRHVARIPASEVATVDAFKKIINSLGFPAGQVKLVAGNTPIEFIREGNVVLAIQNDGSFAPGVKETLIIVARELGKL
ncbi:hypothetical protein OKA04_11555 [Luteolibacter flavescens]|uniref:Uncharacterized protein n=1 Tax=Luteolibacter flavescens TaxID=1859460 RepID=A0ABT3FQ57_9BACT|nr:hypothetical protein [Luteolibacter flavescens]MCW1885366.1 hypothetical protein [Luteolibacter flavescens]